MLPTQVPETIDVRLLESGSHWSEWLVTLLPAIVALVVVWLGNRNARKIAERANATAAEHLATQLAHERDQQRTEFLVQERRELYGRLLRVLTEYLAHVGDVCVAKPSPASRERVEAARVALEVAVMEVQLVGSPSMEDACDRVRHAVASFAPLVGVAAGAADIGAARARGFQTRALVVRVARADLNMQEMAIPS